MKKPTLSELIEATEKAANPDDWYRQSLILEKKIESFANFDASERW
ncbi:hypothetical protein EfmAA610_25310 [Enterococcus faecium]|nr:hypothetical protein EfmAA610_25310 [Enterococcus faecium]